jgi:hypothetical protein
MSHEDSTHWQVRSEKMRALAEQMSEGVSKQVLHRIADDYQRFARMVEDRPNRFAVIATAAPAEVRRFAPCKGYVYQSPGGADLTIPGFLMQGPRPPAD